VTRCGPEALEGRMARTASLADVAAHLSDLAARSAAHLWLLTVSAESLDPPELNRNVRALELLGEESRRARFFAATRRLMLDLMRGRTDTIGPLLGIAEDTMDVLADGPLVLKGQIG